MQHKMTSEKITYDLVAKGLSEVCRMLSEYKAVTPEMKKDFIKYAEVFEKLSHIDKSKLNKEVKMTQDKKKLTQEDIENQKVQEVMSEIVGLEKKYPQKVIKRACYKYNSAVLQKRKAERQIRMLEQELAKAKATLK